MQDPAALFRLETDTNLADLRASTLVVALGGFIDAGHTQRLVVDHLMRTLEHTVVATFDVDQLIDYRARRPQMSFTVDRYTEYTDPSLALYRLVDDAGTPFFLLTGPEPDYQWERVAAAVIMLVKALGVELVVTVYGAPMAVPHTRPVASTVHGTTDELRSLGKRIFGTFTVPGSMAGLLEFRLGELGRSAVSFVVYVPHYLAQGEYPAGAAHGLERLGDVAGLSLPPAALELAAADTAHAIAAEVAASPEAAEIVRTLEEQYDSKLARLEFTDTDSVDDDEDDEDPSARLDASSLPTSDQLGAEVEAVLEDLRRGGN